MSADDAGDTLVVVAAAAEAVVAAGTWTSSRPLSTASRFGDSRSDALRTGDSDERRRR